MLLVLTMDSEMFFGYILLEFMIKKPYPNYFIIFYLSHTFFLTDHSKHKKWFSANDSNCILLYLPFS